MKLLKTSLFLTAICCVVLSTQSCKKDDPCDGVSCENGGTATKTEASCECDCTGTLYIGSDCTTPDPSQVQVLLDDGTTPLELLNNGVPIDSFYGKSYEGGLIFYLTADGTGMVAASEDQIEGAEWGCFGTEISGADGTDLGTGTQNTMDIVNGCMEVGIAAERCNNLDLNGHIDWFLPSKDELNLMYTNLHMNGYGGFPAAFYWSSTEFDSARVWYQVFVDGYQYFAWKDVNNGRVRAARAF